MFKISDLNPTLVKFVLNIIMRMVSEINTMREEEWMSWMRDEF